MDLLPRYEPHCVRIPTLCWSVKCATWKRLNRHYELPKRATLPSPLCIFRTLDLPITITTPDEPKMKGRARGRVEFRNVWFAYKGEDWVLKDVSFVAEPGETIALGGHTGSGKTTITNLRSEEHTA